MPRLTQCGVVILTGAGISRESGLSTSRDVDGIWAISIGTSGPVYPAAGFVADASHARTVELDLGPSAGSALFDDAHHGPAAKVVPAFVERLLHSI